MESIETNFRNDLEYFTDYAIKNNGRVTFSPIDGTITFTRDISDQEYLESIPGLWESIEEASKEVRSGKGVKIDWKKRLASS